MAGPPSAPAPLRVCPFCGVATDVTHENQESCIAALTDEIARVRGILAHVKPAAVPHAPEEEAAVPGAIRLTQD
jgi:hypothetical protein